MKTKILLLTVLFFGVGSSFAQKIGFPSELYSTAEKTDYQVTTLSKDVREFVKVLEQNSPLVTVETFGYSKQGQALQLVIMARPKITSPEEAKKSGKPIIYIQGNIHAGEVEGKEATMRIMREIAFENRGNLLDNQIILFCPNYNPDGNDQLSETSRRSQGGSPKLAGERANGEGYDLNREGMKLEALEAKALMKNVFLRWDPALFVDLHTDNGSWHGYAVNYAPAYNPLGHQGPVNLTREMLPWVKEKVYEKSELGLWWHGYLRNQEGAQGTFTAYGHQPRYVVNNVGLRNRMGILSESFAHQKFEKRTWGTYLLVVNILEYTNLNAEKINNTISTADREMVELIKTQAGQIEWGVNFALTSNPDTVEILVRETETYEENGRRRIRETGKIRWQDNILHFNSFEATKTSKVPFGYAFPKELTGVAEKLREHGIAVVELDKKLKTTGEEFFITAFNKDERSRYPGHFTVSLEGEFKSSKLSLKSGMFYVDMAQPLAALIFYLLEPQSDDGLVYWNYFDEALEGKNYEKGNVKFPVVKVMERL